MKILVNNSTTTVVSPDNELISGLRRLFTMRDKSKEYQVNRMSKNPYARMSKAYEQLKSQVYTSLLDESVPGQVSFPTPLLEVSGLQPTVDSRSSTGKTISLPWDSSYKPVQLRPYQVEAVEKAAKSQRGIINMATGLGKSKVAIFLTRQLKKRTLIVAPNKSIANQLYDELCQCFGKHCIGFYGSGKKKLGDVTVGIAQTVVNHVDDFKAHDLGLVIVDEAHHTAATTFYSIVESLSHVGNIYGLTATAFRSDGKDLLLNAACGFPVVEYDVKWGIQNGWLAEPVFITRKIRTSTPDYDDKLMAYKSHILSATEISSRIEIDAQKMMQAGKATLILVDTIEHGEALSKSLGIPFAKGEDKQSEAYVDQLNQGKIVGLVATEGKAGEGTDTRNVDCLIMAQFTASKGAVLQAVGRGLRKQGNKTHCYILDYWPTSSRMLGRHAAKRVEFYQEITDQVKVLDQ